MQDDEDVARLGDTSVVAKVHLVSARLGIAVFGDMAVFVQAAEGQQQEVLVVVKVEGDSLRIPRGSGHWHVRHGLEGTFGLLDRIRLNIVLVVSVGYLAQKRAAEEVVLHRSLYLREAERGVFHRVGHEILIPVHGNSRAGLFSKQLRLGRFH